MEKGGTSRPQRRSWPAGRSRHSPPARHPLPTPAPASTRGRPRRGAVASRQSSAAAWRACAGVDAPWSAARCARPRQPSSPLPFAPVHSSSLVLSPLLRAHHTATCHWSSPSFLCLVPGISPHPSAFFYLSELRICFRTLGRDFFPQVSLPREPNRASESEWPRRSSPQRWCPWFFLFWPSLASLPHTSWSP